MVRKKPEQMEFPELVELLKWYEDRSKYVKFLISLHEGSNNV